MRLYTIETNGMAKVAVGMDDAMYTVDSFGVDVRDMNELICNWSQLGDVIRQKLANVDVSPVTDYKILAPIIRPLQDVVCLGVNYREHVEETTDVLDFSKKSATVYFSKRVNKCTAPGDVIPDYGFVDKLDYEVELGVILGRDAFRVDVESADDYIFGYTIINDVSARDIQLKHQQWYFGKSLDGYTPMGPCIVTADEIDNVHDLDITCHVNGEKRQSSNTGYMITTVEAAIAELSQGMTLSAGTVIATGTPGGVGMGMKPPVYLESGDVVRCEIENIGVLENTVE